MQTVTEKIFKLAPPGGLFDETTLCNRCPETMRPKMLSAKIREYAPVNQQLEP